jgi:hypothetical protein
MNPTITIPQHGVVGPTTFDELATLVGLSPTHTHDDLSPKAEKLVASVRAIVDDIALRCIERKTAGDFKKVRDEVFPSYFALLVAVSMVAEHTIPQGALERMIAESLSEVEAKFREKESEGLLGSTMKEQAVFTVWTLRKTSDILLTIAKNPGTANQKEVDAKFARDFSVHAGWTQFHLECLFAAIRHKKTIYPEVGELVLDGLRAAVNAYAFARQGMDLRMPQVEPDVAPYQWDEEDQELLNSSMADVDEEDA